MYIATLSADQGGAPCVYVVDLAPGGNVALGCDAVLHPSREAIEAAYPGVLIIWPGDA